MAYNHHISSIDACAIIRQTLVILLLVLKLMHEPGLYTNIHQQVTISGDFFGVFCVLSNLI